MEKDKNKSIAKEADKTQITDKHWEEFVKSLPKPEKVMLKENAPLQPKVIFHIIREEGEEEIARSFRALAFSALAAGIFVSFSFLFRACFRMYMADFSWGPMVSSLGYTVGFLIVILGRMQLFTENPITTIVPLLEDFSWKRFTKVIGLWTTVFVFNIIGTTIAAAFLSLPNAVSPEVAVALHELAEHVTKMNAIDNIIRGIPAGIIIAALVWLSPSTRYFRFFAITFFIYFIALGGFAHVVVGSCEMAYEVIAGEANFFDYFFRFLIPTGLGNVIGGTGIFTLLIYNQIKGDLSLINKK